MSAEANARRLGLEFPPPGEPKKWAPCVRAGNLIFTAGHTSHIEGKLGATLDVEQGYAAAREAMIRVLQSVRRETGTLDGLRVVKLLGFVNAAPDFTEHPQVMHGASDLLHQVFGQAGAGAHARSAVGLASLPRGAAVEIEAIFEVTT